ncbi:hypothetical protein FB45DRAFT_1093139 [Roridomyces roridus]|uniref:F-box domain-containing protein n=1 Tax=Roridomyces roridus TaxID=1738132 RepID=A0AAD7BIC4_9AGAR|nr:hypothetical protein FB45DRAFT_1093139 [Roridomyces roridus]
MSISLRDFPADIIFSVFAFCDISNVLSIAKTCKYLHGLGFEKSVWMELLTDLKRRCFLDEVYTPVLHQLFTEELVNLVKRVLLGPETWSSDAHPQVVRQFTVHPTTKQHITPHEDSCKFFHRGRFLLYNNNGYTKCWDVVADTLLWVHQPTEEHTTAYEFAAELRLDGGQSLLIMICLLKYVLFTVH